MNLRITTELEEMQSLYSDLYKDLNGFRPRSLSPELRGNLEWLKLECRNMSDEITAQIDAEEAAQTDLQNHEELDLLEHDGFFGDY